MRACGFARAHFGPQSLRRPAVPSLPGCSADVELPASDSPEPPSPAAVSPPGLDGESLAGVEGASEPLEPHAESVSNRIVKAVIFNAMHPIPAKASVLLIMKVGVYFDMDRRLR